MLIRLYVGWGVKHMENFCILIIFMRGVAYFNYNNNMASPVWLELVWPKPENRTCFAGPGVDIDVNVCV